MIVHENMHVCDWRALQDLSLGFRRLRKAMREKVEGGHVAQTDFNTLSQHLSIPSKAKAFITYVAFELLHALCFAKYKILKSGFQ